MSTKRSAEDTIGASLAEEGAILSGSTGSMSTSKRIKWWPKDTATHTSSPNDAEDEPATSNPTKSVLTNPDTLSKALLCLDVRDIPSVARTCKVWNSTLGSVEDKLWLGLVRKHHPTLETIKAMLADNGASWKETFKRRRTIKAPDWIDPPLAKPLDSYVFEVICKPYGLADGMPLGEGGLATVVEKAIFDPFSRGPRLRLFPIEIPDPSFVLSVRIHDRVSGQQAVLLDKCFVATSPYFIDDSATVGGLVHYRSEESEQVEVKLYAKPRLDEILVGGFAGSFEFSLGFKVHMYQEQGHRAHINKGAKLGRAQILDMIQNHLDWN